MKQLKKTNIYITGNKLAIENVTFGKELTVTKEVTDTEENKAHTWYKITGQTNSTKTSKISFTTNQDNVNISFKIKSSSESGFDYVYLTEIDSANTQYNSNIVNKVSGNGTEKVVDYTVKKAGDHYIYVCYRKDGSGNSYNDCGYVCLLTKIGIQVTEIKSVYVENSKVQQMNVQGKDLFEYELGNTISWETLEWTKSTPNNSYTYNTKEKLKISYNNKYVYLTNSPAIIATKPYQLKFYNINDYHNYGPYSTYNCTYKLDLSDLVTSNITSMSSMFSGCTVLTSLDLSNWNTSKVTRMDSMFSGCKSITSLDLSSWDTSNILNFFDSNNGGMFENCENLVDLKLPKNFITSKVTNIINMFKGCKSLTSLDLSSWDTSNIEDMDDLFVDCGIRIIDLSNWDFSNLNIQTQKFGWMFRNANCETIILPNIKKYKDLNKCAFYNIYNLKYFYANELVNSNVFDIDDLFNSDSNLISLDMTDWDFSNITKASRMFYNCSSLTTLINEHEHEPDVMAFKWMKISIDLHYSTKLNYESVYALFRGVATVTTTQTITLPKVMEGKLDAAKVKIATDKGWTVAYK